MQNLPPKNKSKKSVSILLSLYLKPLYSLWTESLLDFSRVLKRLWMEILGDWSLIYFTLYPKPLYISYPGPNISTQTLPPKKNDVSPRHFQNPTNEEASGSMYIRFLRYAFLNILNSNLLYGISTSNKDHVYYYPVCRHEIS